MKFDTPLCINVEPQLEDFQKEHHLNLRMAEIIFRVSYDIWLRTRLAEAQNWRCCWCSRPVSIKRKRRDSATIEHVIPKSKGGTSDPENLAMSCARCNSSRGSTDAEKFFASKNNQKTS
jgi:5-methylcytosine-specific restriction endonuclease McrA